MALTTTQLDSVSKQVYQKFPELKGVSPDVQSRNAAGAKSIAQNYLLIFKGTQATHKSIVRVTTDAQGKVIKMSASR